MAAQRRRSSVCYSEYRNRRVASSMPILVIVFCVASLRNTHANIATSGGAAQSIRAKIASRKIIGCRFGS